MSTSYLRLDLAPASVRKVHRVLSMILAYAVKDGRLAVNPATEVSLPRVRQPEKRFLNARAGRRPRRRMRFRVSAHGAVPGLYRFCGAARWQRSGCIGSISCGVAPAESVSPVKGVMTFGPTKGNERRDVPLPRFLLEDLSHHVERKSPDNLVFARIRGAALCYPVFQRGALNYACERIGIPRLTPHELRHAAASLAIASGADIKVVQSLLGHKSATMTLDQYGHLFGDRFDVVADAMDAARTAALSDRHQIGTKQAPAEVVELRNRR